LAGLSYLGLQAGDFCQVLHQVRNQRTARSFAFVTAFQSYCLSAPKQ